MSTTNDEQGKYVTITQKTVSKANITKAMDEFEAALNKQPKREPHAFAGLFDSETVLKALAKDRDRATPEEIEAATLVLRMVKRKIASAHLVDPIAFWDFMTAECMADRKEYSKEEQAEVLTLFLRKSKSTIDDPVALEVHRITQAIASGELMVVRTVEWDHFRNKCKACGWGNDGIYQGTKFCGGCAGAITNPDA